MNSADVLQLAHEAIDASGGFTRCENLMVHIIIRALFDYLDEFFLLNLHAHFSNLVALVTSLHVFPGLLF